MFVKISRLINQYFIIIIVIHKNANKHYINIAFHNFEIKLNQDSKMANFNYKVQNSKCSKIKYLDH